MVHISFCKLCISFPYGQRHDLILHIRALKLNRQTWPQHLCVHTEKQTHKQTDKTNRSTVTTKSLNWASFIHSLIHLVILSLCLPPCVSVRHPEEAESPQLMRSSAQDDDAPLVLSQGFLLPSMATGSCYAIPSSLQLSSAHPWPRPLPPPPPPPPPLTHNPLWPNGLGRHERRGKEGPVSGITTVTRWDEAR